MEKINIPEENSLDSLEGIPDLKKDQDEFPIENNKFLKEGLEKWFEVVAEYWGNYVENRSSCSILERQAYDNPQNQFDELIKSYRQAVVDIHHRLASTIGTVKNALIEANFGTPDQIDILKRIQENSAREGKNTRYSSYKKENPIHPVQKIYGNIFVGKEPISNDEMILLKKETYEMGVSASLFRSIDELTSWFVWAGGEQFVSSGGLLPIPLLRLRNGYLKYDNNNTSEERQLLDECDVIYKALESIKSIKDYSTEEFTDLARRSEKAKKEWIEKYLPKLQISESFWDYVKKPD